MSAGARLRVLIKAGLIPVLLVAATGCSYLGTAREFDPAELDASGDWIAVRNVAVHRQTAESDCGIAALAMIFEYWHLEGWSRERIQASCPIVEDRGTRARDLRSCARQAGLESTLIHGSWMDLCRELLLGRPVLVGLVKPTIWGPVTHYELVVGLHLRDRLVVTLDPAHGWRQNTVEGFLTEWEATTGLLMVFDRAGGASP
jgi:ABC-type bacteriocin/lantibiotic exporter with double-glycine peptidase domain